MDILSFKNDVSRRIDSLSKFTLSPEFSFSFRARYDFIFADFLKIPSVEWPFLVDFKRHIQRGVGMLSFSQTSVREAPKSWPSFKAGRVVHRLSWQVLEPCQKKGS